MSLFGEPSPTEAAPSKPNSKSLFGNEPAGASSTSLFDDNSADGSPWSMPTPKKAARQNLLKTLLPATDVPESYIDAYDIVQQQEGSISYATVSAILKSSNISADDSARILSFVVPGGEGGFTPIARNEFNVLLALIGLAQEGEEVSLDGVDERRRSTLLHQRVVLC